jgi:hypothetical protein
MRFSLCLSLCLTATACDGFLPVREQPVFDCAAEADCAGSGQTCKINQCSACTAHTDCQSLVCDTYGDFGSAGQCVAPGKIFYVDNGDGNAHNCPIATGSLALPFCDLQTALGKLTASPGKILRALPSRDTYQLPPVLDLSSPVVLIGSGVATAGQATLMTAITEDNRIQIGAGAQVTLDGFVMSPDGITTGVMGVAPVATPGKLTLRRSTVMNMVGGAAFNNGAVIIDRVLFTQNTAALKFTGTSVGITNTFVTASSAGQNASLLSFSGASGTMQFVTVAYNSASGAPPMPTVSCASSTGLLIKNSIFANNGAPQELAQSCQSTPTSLIVGTADTGSGQVKQDPAFLDPGALDLRLKAGDATNLGYIIDKAVQVSTADKNVDHDYYGNPRPIGGGYDIGAFEAM